MPPPTRPPPVKEAPRAGPSSWPPLSAAAGRAFRTGQHCPCASALAPLPLYMMGSAVPECRTAAPYRSAVRHYMMGSAAVPRRSASATRSDRGPFLGPD
ncbi:hypothetical protein TSOC_011788 [Tetrabaena socialis]|uniref:Uncharacterized protein n=1 Tax=Tetrabaena socialis TaxID=47790 RepID=A0A2J7ZPU1_9CHLO|nr:hypothetical protein TSOC_011788 [Tetrabaena socialis]|eukprot:PNH02262.1 hypothetical protein TSOC_011788 [Tetrabaena socialis]